MAGMAPMLATPGPPPSGAGWAWEMKWDGQRCVARVAGDRLRLVSRNGSPITSSYPEIATALVKASGGRDVVVDGEIVVLDKAGRPSFSMLQRRMHVQRPPRRLLGEVPAAFYVFDLIDLDGTDVAPLPYLERRDLLAATVASTGAVQVTPYWTDVTAAEMVGMATDFGLEGVVAKRKSSRYLRGQRSPAWVKIPLRLTGEVIVCGWTGRPSSMRSLLVGGYSSTGELAYLGEVGTGFTERDRRDIASRLTKIAAAAHPFTTSPPSMETRVRWVQPTLVGTVEYREFNRRLRHPSWKGLRPDKLKPRRFGPNSVDRFSHEPSVGFTACGRRSPIHAAPPSACNR